MESSVTQHGTAQTWAGRDPAEWLRHEWQGSKWRLWAACYNALARAFGSGWHTALTEDERIALCLLFGRLMPTREGIYEEAETFRLHLGPRLKDLAIQAARDLPPRP
jgi:hypothetical protein